MSRKKLIWLIKLKRWKSTEETHRRFSFRKLLERQPTKLNIVVTFLAVLELMKSGKIKVVQEHLFDDIIIDMTEEAG